MNPLSIREFKRVEIALFLIALVAIVFRHVDLFLFPRFWAEEGSVYFTSAMAHGVDSLWLSHQGYYSLIPNVATYLATWVPLDRAPAVTTVIAFIVQLIPFILISASQSMFLSTWKQKALAMAVVLFIGNTGEIWLNTINSQFHAIVILFLVLLESREPNIGRGKCGFLGVLTLVAGLSGIPANILAPVFFYVYITTGNALALRLFSVLCFTTILQLFFVLSLDHGSRIGSFGIPVLTKVVLGTIQYPIFRTYGLSALTLLTIPLVLAVFKYLRKKDYFLLFFGSTFLLTALLILMSLGMRGGGRYSYAPSVIFVMGLIAASFDRSLGVLPRRIFGFYLSLSLVVGCLMFPFRGGLWDAKDWKRWSSEVEQFESGEKTELYIYPQWEKKRWTLTLETTNSVHQK
ncbi:Uncharacterised protein [BD1-7 clade bacterium]|uniref:Glycosyltransferase RgtA/B/C/D-like domain-containing protein n=1 Tax=BD1-7 clade bacterium TaxID=2029982 RepID=A0A5S9PK56_9GAMM|nr:Uncharacterised protein [BD1-7 clade bacterium]